MSAKVKSIDTARRVLAAKNKKETNVFHWLLGTWQNVKTEDTYETWETNEENNMVGHGFKVLKGEKIISEYIRIYQKEGQYIYESKLPQIEEAVSFKVTITSECGFVCDNYDYDFPKKIRYELNGYDSLDTELSGFKRKIEFSFRKVE